MDFPIKNYLEMKETLSQDDEFNCVVPVLIRVEVNDKAGAINKKPQFLQYFAGKSYKAKYQIVRHPGGSCSEEEI
jgi:hypothetical protein